MSYLRAVSKYVLKFKKKNICVFKTIEISSHLQA